MHHTTLDSSQRRALRRIAHHLDPIVLVGDQGISAGVIAETNRALQDHELIKIRVPGDDRDLRARLVTELADACGAAVVQSIGKVSVLYRTNPEAEARLSNVQRFGG